MTDDRNKPTKLDEPARKTGGNPEVLQTIHVQIDPPAEEDFIITHIKPDTPEQLQRKALVQDVAQAIRCDPQTLEVAKYSDYDLNDILGWAKRCKKMRAKSFVISAVFAVAAVAGMATLPERQKEPAVWMFIFSAAAYGIGRRWDLRSALREDAELTAKRRVHMDHMIKTNGFPKAPPPPPCQRKP
ncbi:hypothetical protein [Micavibrio aeruginosavorus]|uniref:hypothetical protein n=1 Tax=Micavibrio aeruginosavorus TaxID=349221 RepID=UPI003F4AA305